MKRISMKRAFWEGSAAIVIFILGAFLGHRFWPPPVTPVKDISPTTNPAWHSLREMFHAGVVMDYEKAYSVSKESARTLFGHIVVEPPPGESITRYVDLVKHLQGSTDRVRSVHPMVLTNGILRTPAGVTIQAVQIIGCDLSLLRDSFEKTSPRVEYLGGLSSEIHANTSVAAGAREGMVLSGGVLGNGPGRLVGKSLKLKTLRADGSNIRSPEAQLNVKGIVLGGMADLQSIAFVDLPTSQRMHLDSSCCSAIWLRLKDGDLNDKQIRIIIGEVSRSIKELAVEVSEYKNLSVQSYIEKHSEYIGPVKARLDFVKDVYNRIGDAE